MKKVLKYFVWKVVYPLILFGIIAYGIIGINNDWQYSIEVWRVARVYLWWLIFVNSLAFFVHAVASSNKKLKKQFYEIDKKSLNAPPVVGIVTAIIEIVLLAWFGSALYCGISIFALFFALLCASFMNNIRKDIEIEN